MSRGGSSSQPPVPCFTVDIPSLVTQLQEEILSLRRGLVGPGTHQVITDMERILGHLHTLDDPARLRAWIDTVCTDSAHRHGLTLTEIRELPDIRERTLAQFPGRDGTLPRSGPLRVTCCMAAHIKAQD